MSVFQVILYIIIAIMTAVLSEGIFGRQARGGITGTVILSFISALLTVQLFRFTITGEPVVNGVPLFSAIIGAAIGALLWAIIAYPRTRRSG